MLAELLWRRISLFTSDTIIKVLGELLVLEKRRQGRWLFKDIEVRALADRITSVVSIFIFEIHITLSIVVFCCSGVSLRGVLGIRSIIATLSIRSKLYFNF